MEDRYRVGTRIVEAWPGEPVDEDVTAYEPIGTGPAVPVEAEFTCPACKQRAIFGLEGIQTGRAIDQGLMPLYTCGACKSTRTIVSILTMNHPSAG